MAVRRKWVYSDPHFYHTNILKFGTYKGDKLRPLWDDVGKMSEDLINWFNELVNDDDRVYLLGDIAMSSEATKKSLPRLKGKKVLIKGNHDEAKLSFYAQHVEDIRATSQQKGFVMSHVPLHPDCLERWGLNIHGHLHDNRIKLPDNRIDTRYFCACVEQTNWRPILLEEILDTVNSA